MSKTWTGRLRLHGTFLRSRLGRRIFLMFSIAALVPSIAVSALTYRATARDAQEATQAALRAENKYFALSVYERLQTADAMLAGYRSGSDAPAGGASALAPYFVDIVALDRAHRDHGAGPLARRLAGQEFPGLGEPLLVVLPSASGASADVVLIRETAGANGPVLLAGSVNPSFLWGDPEEVAIEGRNCVRAGTQPLFCMGVAPATGSNGASVRDQWDLYLNARFGAGSWTFEAVRPHPLLRTAHLHVLAPLLASLLLLALLLSSIEIRRILVPLEALMARINAVGAGERAPARRGNEDEIGALARTFHEMERRIGRQMETLTILARIDRMILDRVESQVVVSLVMTRVRTLVEVAAVGVTLRSSKPSGGRSHFVWSRAQEKPECGDSQRLAPLRGQTYSAHSVGRWRKSDQVGPGFVKHGVRQLLMLPLGTRDGASAWLALGWLQGPGPDPGALDEVRELAERIAVAMAVEEHEGMLVFQARHDALTGLDNRLAAVEELSVAVERSRANGREFAVVFVDLDRFKSINDGLGHALGDTILMHAGERIRKSLGANDFVARFGGDEFLVILRDARTAAEAARAAARISAAFEDPIVVEGIELVVGFSAGVAMHPRHGTDAHQLIHNSDVAMYRAKKSGGGRMEFFNEEMNAAAQTRMHLESDLRLAIRSQQLHLHYQPRVDGRTGRIVAAEALVRWTHPTRGEIAPTTFISVAEQTGMIEELGTFVLNEACRQLAVWKRAGLSLPLVAVNVSSHQLRSGALPELVAAAVGASGIAWHELELEVTESLLVNDTGTAAQQLQEIRDAGATVAIDDFGTGYSSLAYLTLLPTDTLKIDSAFMANLDGTEGPAAVIRSIIALAHALGKNLVAEGVESMEQVDMLHAWGCDIIQGYVYYRPLAPAALAAVLAERSGMLPSPSIA